MSSATGVMLVCCCEGSMLWRRGSGRLQAAPRSARRSVNGVATVVARVWSGLVVRRLNHRPRAHSSVLRAAPVFEPRCVGTFRPLFPRCVQSLPRRLLHVPRRLLHIHAHAYPEKIRYDCWVSHATRLARSAVPQFRYAGPILCRSIAYRFPPRQAPRVLKQHHLIVHAAVPVSRGAGRVVLASACTISRERRHRHGGPRR